MEIAAYDFGLLVLRVGVGIPFALHGFQKLLGWFGGGGIKGTSAWFSSLGFGNGKVATLVAGTGEIVGGVGLALGLLTPVSAAAVAGTMTTAAFVNNAASGFWSVSKGWELNGYLIVVATALAITGPGSLSLDAALDLPDLIGVPLNGVTGALLVGAAVFGGWLRWTTRTKEQT